MMTMMMVLMMTMMVIMVLMLPVGSRMVDDADVADGDTARDGRLLLSSRRGHLGNKHIGVLVTLDAEAGCHWKVVSFQPWEAPKNKTRVIVIHFGPGKLRDT